MPQCKVSALAERCAASGFAISGEQAAKLAAYLDLLLRWNARMNLVGARTWEKILDDLVLDSFWLAQFLKKIPVKLEEESQIWDLGAGAGLPGIPLRILWNPGQYWLVESREKRALFLSTVLTRLQLPRTAVFRGRAEAFMPEKKATLVLSRAFMPWPALLQLVEPYLQPEGRVIMLGNEPFPGLTNTSGWSVAEESNYPVFSGKGHQTRHITALAPCCRHSV